MSPTAFSRPVRRHHYLDTVAAAGLAAGHIRVRSIAKGVIFSLTDGVICRNKYGYVSLHLLIHIFTAFASVLDFERV